MPLYEYECERCGEFEAHQRITARPLRHCPKCDGQVRRLISLTAGHVVEPNGVYQPLPGLDAHGKGREEKISPKEYERRDQALKKRMLATRDFAKLKGFTPQING